MKLKDFNFGKLKYYKKFSLVLISEDPGVQSKTHKITMMPAVLLLFSYTLLIALIGFIFFSYTPVRTIVFPHSGTLSSNDKEMIQELNKRMIFLTKELEKIKIANEVLKNSIQPPPEVKTNVKGGALYSVMLDFLEKFIYQKGEDVSFSNPSIGYISRGFLPDNGHMGIDFVLKSGTPVYSSASGYVLFSDYTSKEGYVIIIAHPSNYFTFYKHCSSLIKKERDRVTQGELIALSGNSGEITSGPHLHFEIWKNGKPIDPLTVLITKKEVK